MTADELRMNAAQTLNSQAEQHTEESLRAELSKRYDDICNIDELRQQYQVVAFLAPYVQVERISDGVVGTMKFTHSPRLYFGFQEA